MMPNRGLDGGARQIGELLAGERHRHERSASFLPADLTAELQEQTGEADLDFGAGDLSEPAGQLGQPDRQTREQATNDLRVLLEQTKERRLLDPEALRVFERHRRRHERNPFVDGNRAERVAGSEDLENDFLACGRGLEHLDAAGDDRDERIARVAFREDQITARERYQVRDVGDSAALRRGQPAKHGDSAKKIVVGLRHQRIIADGRRELAHHHDLAGLATGFAMPRSR